MPAYFLSFGMLSVAALLLVGCTGSPAFTGGSHQTILSDVHRSSVGSPGAARSMPLSGGASSSAERIVEYGLAGSEGSMPAQDPELSELSVTLGFVDTEVQEVARVLFSEMLKRPYVVDSTVSGRVTLRSGGQVDGNAALNLAGQAFRTVGSTIRYVDGVYRISSAGGADGSAISDTRTFDLVYVDAQSAYRAVQPLVSGRGEIVVSGQNELTLKGDAEIIALAESMLSSIDVDRFRNASFGLFPLKNGSAAVVTPELKGLFTAVGVTSQTLIPIDRMNAILVIAEQAGHIDFAEKWLRRLDQGATDERKVYIYQVQNRDAVQLADLAKSIFERAADGSPTVVPVQFDVAMAAEGASPPAAPSASEKQGIRITADDGSNTLVVWATSTEFELIEGALRRLDVPLSQVFVEATIAEVRLNNELSRGVRWFLQAGPFSAGISDTNTGVVTPSYPGFNFSFKVPEAQVVISALEAHTEVRIVSSPQLTVIDRETAVIQVGDQVPVVTRTVKDASSGGNIIANDVVFRDTGVILKVTPQIRAAGEVVLDIEQEVSRVVPTASSQINSPTISQRKVASTVMVPSGTAIVLGGLMSSGEETGQGGMPGTKNTLLEGIFGSKTNTATRSELIVIIRPIIINNSANLVQIVDEIASKMSNVLSLPSD